MMRIWLSGVAALLTLIGGCTSKPIHETRFMMGTLVEFTLVGIPQEQALKAIAAASDEMTRIERKFTIYGAGSNIIKRFNRSKPGVPVRVDDETDALLQLAIEVEKASGGAFQPALGALDRLWGFSLEPPPTHPPAATAIRQLLPPGSCIRRTGLRQWQRTTVACQIDLGAIAKGYALERGIRMLRKHGIGQALINAGGDIAILGSRDRAPWRIGIRHPRQAGAIVGWIESTGGESIVTSGDYERFFMYYGKRYHHILDPRTGYPARKVASATVIAPTATLADAWSTALFVMGSKGLALLQRLGMAALVTDNLGRVHMNQAMRARFHPSPTKALAAPAKAA